MDFTVLAKGIALAGWGIGETGRAIKRQNYRINEKEKSKCVHMSVC